ncbi:MAG: U32 family peptidase [Clostridia bacterium]|nr:U32 family peptidase [Clostridia bacterium]
MRTKPELLAPAGGREALIAAVQNGADAVYLGAGNFNARQSADNFDGDGLSEAIAYCHARNTQVFVTLNTMVREDEIPALEDSIRAIALAGADAVLVQDFGVARIVKQVAPSLPLHASTQMAVHNRAGVEFLAKQGFDRVVLAREMDLESIRECAGLGPELEVFVHGALCVACSGQCLFSSLVGARSGNRGRCAQPCRLRYRMDGKEGHLLSTKDLCSINSLEALRDAGVDSFKIEGRLKRPEYVASVTRAYRAAIDDFSRKQDVEPLKQMFNRGGFTKGYVPGADDSELMYHERPNHLGVPVGTAPRKGQLKLENDIDSADALALRGSGDDRPVKLSGRKGETVTCPDARQGDKLIRLVSEEQMRAARESFAGESRVTSLTAALTLRVGLPAELTVSDGVHTFAVQGEPVQPAKSKGADPDRIEAQLRKTGGTPYVFEEITLNVDENAFCPVSVLNALRRDALEGLTAVRLPVKPEIFPMQRAETDSHAYPAVPAVRVQSGNPEILRRAGELGADGVIFAPEDLRIDALNAAAAVLPEHFSLAVPMVLAQKTLEELHAWAVAHRNRIDRTYLSNIGHFALDWPGEKHADYGLNLANAHALEQMRLWGCVGCTPSVELNAAQIDNLSGRRELIVHGRLPLMHLRHCPYRAVHGLKGRHADCRRCDKCAFEDSVNARTLTDRTGADFPLRRTATDEGCIVKVMNSVPLMLLKRIRRLPKADGWRLLIDNPAELEGALHLYRLAARGEDFRTDGFWPEFERMNTTTGHYFRGAE